MSLFEYIMVLTSILIALGIAELLNGIVRILRSEFEEKLYIPQFLWAILAFFWLILMWWSRWDLRNNLEWNFFHLLMSMTGPILIFIIAGLVFPHNMNSREYYFKQKKKLLTLLILNFLVSMFHEILIEGSALLSLETGLLSNHILFSVIALTSDKELPQYLAPIVAISGAMFYIFSALFILVA